MTEENTQMEVQQEQVINEASAPIAPEHSESQASIDAAATEDLERELAKLSENLPADDTPDQPVAEEEAPATPAADDEEYEYVEVDPDAIRAEAARDAERRAAGRWGSQKQQYEATIAQLQNQLQSLQAAPASAPSAAPSSAPAPNKTEVTDEEIAAVCGDDWSDTWMRDDAVKEVLRERRKMAFYRGGSAQSVPDVEERVHNAFQQEAARLNQQRQADAFREQVLSMEGAAEIEANAKTNGFAKFLDSTMPGTTMSRRDVVNVALHQARTSVDPAIVKHSAQVIQGFYREFAGQSQPSQTRPVQDNSVDASRYMAPSAPSGSSDAFAPVRGKYTQQQVDRYLERELAKGEQAYIAALDWVCQQEAMGRIAH